MYRTTRLFRVMSIIQRRMSVPRSDEEWERVLTPEQFRVTRLKGTETPFTGEYCHFNAAGEYVCVCCGAKLFESTTKFNSGCGWPSFYQAAGADGRDDANTNITRAEDDSLGMKRIEVMCKHCNAHLGHVFDDGPQPTGLRYCINSASLKFKKQ